MQTCNILWSFVLCVAAIGFSATERSVSAGSEGPATQAAARPNILVILTDDIGWGDPQCYNSRGRIPSPNVDQLARDGMRFTNAHAPAALCSPTRYSMLTGNYPWRGRAPGGTWTFHCPSQVLPGQKTVAELLRTAGYRTAMFGKAGFGGFFEAKLAGKEVKPEELASRELGLDYSYLIPRGHQSSPYAFFENGVTTSKLQWSGKGSLKATDWDTSKVGERLMTKATQFLDDHLAKNKADGKDRPFFIHFCTDGAHSPYEPAATLLGTRLKGASKMTAHTDMVHETDIMAGKLIKALEQRGLLANTLIVYTSDNGGMPFERRQGHDAVGGLRGRKGSIFEGGHRVPFVVRWGDGTPQGSKIPPGAVRNQVVGIHDVVATTLDLAGVAVPPDQCLDAVSLVPVLLGKQDDSQPVRQALLVQSSADRDAFDDLGFTNADVETPNGEAKVKAAERKGEKKANKGEKEKLPSDGIAHAVLVGDWKLVIDIKHDQPAALYDLKTDMAEQKNLISDPVHTDRVKTMFAVYRQIRESKRSVPVR